MPDPDVERITAARREAAAVEASLRAVAVTRRRAEAARQRLAAAGAGPEAIRSPAAAEEEAAAEASALASRLAALRARIGELSNELVGAEAPEDVLALLDGRVPVALLPVRIETRFADGGTTLHVRVFPEQLHVDSHEPELTDDEVDAATEYWRRRWAAPTDAGEAARAWEMVAARFRPTRARYVIDAYRPTNAVGAAAGPAFPEVARRASTWTRPARAVALPDRWAVVGFRQDQPLFRVWSGFVPDELAVTPAPVDDESAPGPEGAAGAAGTEGAEGATGLGVDASLRWLVDPEAARAAGALVTVRDGDLAGGARLSDGIDELVVVGVDWTRTPEDAAAELGRALGAHAHTDGLAFLRQGTPTNNTSTTASGHTSSRAAQVAALAPRLDEAPALDPERAASRRLAAAFGLDVDATRVLDDAPGAALEEQAVARSVFDATWEATGGYYLGQMLRPADGSEPPLVAPVDIDLVREWAAAHVSACGPLPAVRVGSQPYGVVPVVDPSGFTPAPGARAADLVHGTLSRLRAWWERGIATVARIEGVGTNTDLDATLLALLQQSPVAATTYFRRVFGPLAVVNLSGFDDLSQTQHFQNWIAASMALGRMAGRLPAVAGYTTDPRPYRLPVPFARPAGLGDGEPIPYIGEIRDLLTADGGRQALLARSDAPTLGEAFFAAAAAAELDTTHGRVAGHLAETLGIVTPLRESPRVQVDELLRIGETGRPPLSFSTPRELAEATVPGGTTNLTIAETVRAEVLEVVNGTAPPRPELAGLTRTIQALDHLRAVPGEDVEWAFRGLLDLFSHRLDAWYTGLAHDHLTRVRAERPAGVHVGCFGWVENLRPDPPGRDSLGWVHTPSLAHAATAAVLRSGHLEHRDEAAEVLAVDLSSARVRLALSLLDGVAQGQTLGALIGYRIERLLRERDIELARYILPLRRLAPLRHTDAGLDRPVEAIAAHDVVDGVALLERWRAAGGREALLAEAEVRPADRDGVSGVMDAAASTYDAVSDVLVAEAVFQMVRGNTDRAAAALAALDRQELPVSPQVVATPRSGAVVAHRVVVLLDAVDAPGWPAAIASDPRAAAEPRLNGWAARILGPAASLVFAGEVRRGGVARATVQVSADELGLSPLGFALAAAPGPAPGSAGPSELDRRVARALAARITGAQEDDQLVLLDDAPGGASPAAVGLGIARSLATWIVQVGRSPAADGRDLATPQSDAPAGVDVDELRSRADDVVATLDAVIGDLTAAPAGGGPAMLAALEAASRLGLPDTVTVAGAGADATAALAAQTARALAVASAARARVTGLEAAFAARSDPTAAEVVDHEVGRVRAVLGDGFPVLPRFSVPEPASVGASLADRPALVAGDELAPLSWLHRMALVRPELDALSSVLTAAEALGRDAGLPHLDVVQLPHEPGRAWVALGDADDGAATGTLGIVAHAPGGIDPGRPVAGVVVDHWNETIPTGEETTGLTFHYDAPAARAPQAIVLAVPASVDADRWSFEGLLGTVREAMALTRIRAVGPKELPDLGGFLPAIYLPADFTGDVPSVDPFEIIRKHVAVSTANPVLGRE